MFRRVYLDNAATTPIDPRVVETMLPFLTEKFGNASSIHFFGQEARAAVDKARHQVADLIKARPNEVVFTSGGTEANNLAIHGLIESVVRKDMADESRPHVITSAIEHPAVGSVLEDLEKHGVSVTYLPVYENGLVRVEDVRNALNANTVLVSVMLVNNEIGTIQPVGEIAELVKEVRAAGQKIYLHTDAVQAAGKLRVDVQEIGCDLLTISAHKIYAPKGVGALYIKRGTRLKAQNLGGRQERGIRGGTESVPLIAAFGKAAELVKEEFDDDTSKLLVMRDRFEESVFETIEGAFLNGEKDSRIPNISNISFDGVEGEGLLINLDMQGIAVSTGSACSSGSLEPSPVIRALGRDDNLSRGAIRFSFGRMNEPEDVARVVEMLPACIENLRKLSNSVGR